MKKYKIIRDEGKYCVIGCDWNFYDKIYQKWMKIGEKKSKTENIIGKLL